MKILISPAKSLNLESDLPTSKYTTPLYVDTALQIQRKLARCSKQEIADLMHISDKLADLNYTRFQDFKEEHSPATSRPAIYTFDGDVYDGLDAYQIPETKIDVLQNRLRILSGLYGILKPLDLIQAYRLEMGTKFGIEGKENLYQVWQDKVTRSLNAELNEEDLLINLASKEYSKAVNLTKIKAKVIQPIFKDFKNGKLKIISFYAKKARGSMARFIIDKNVESLMDLLHFNYDEYSFSQEHTKKETEPVFIR